MSTEISAARMIVSRTEDDAAKTLSMQRLCVSLELINAFVDIQLDRIQASFNEEVTAVCFPVNYAEEQPAPGFAALG